MMLFEVCLFIRLETLYRIYNEFYLVDIKGFKAMKKLFTISLFSLFLIACSSSDNAEIINISPIESAGLQSNDFAVIIDVRSDREWDKSRIPGAIHIPLSELKDRMDELKSFGNKQLIMQCAVGGRSSKAVEILQQAGFTDVSNMNGGLIAWQKANLPID